MFKSLWQWILSGLRYLSVRRRQIIYTLILLYAFWNLALDSFGISELPETVQVFYMLVVFVSVTAIIILNSQVVVNEIIEGKFKAIEKKIKDLEKKV